MSVNNRKVTKNLPNIVQQMLKNELATKKLQDAAVAYFAALAGGKDFYVPPTAVKIVSQGDTISEFQDRAVGFPYGNIDRIAGVEHGASG